MRVVFDTNTIFSTRRRPLYGTAFDAIVNVRDRVQIDLFIPEVVKIELIKQFDSDVTEKVENFERAKQQLNDSISEPELHIQQSRVQSQRLVAAFERSLEKRIAELQVSVVPCAPVSHGLILRRYADGRRPFSHKGRGYQDTLIWESILEACATDDDTTYFITNDRDFSDTDGKLHPDLVRDLEERQLAATSVTLCRTLDDFIREHLDLETRAWASLKSILDDGTWMDFGDLWINQHDQIAALVQDKLSETVMQNVLGVPTVLFRLDHLDINVQDELDSELTLLDNDVALARCPAAVLSEFESLIERRDLAKLPKDRAVAVEDPNWNDSLGLVKAVCVLRFSIHCVLNRKSHEILSWDVGAADVVGLADV